MLNKTKIQEQLLENLNYEPTGSQISAINSLSEFLIDQNQIMPIFILKGYAGTGKTTLINALVKTLSNFNVSTVLLAPTGRSAKVITTYTNERAFTIHKKIYRLSQSSSGSIAVKLQHNKHKKTLFIVDEASMIGDNSHSDSNQLFANQGLLIDLTEYVFESSQCKLLLIGDTAQLPPVHLDISPALDSDYISKNISSDLLVVELKEVVRQSKESGILHNASRLRNVIESRNQDAHFVFELENYDDMVKLNGNDLEDQLNSSYSRHGIEDTIVICRSNKRANQYNKEIRARILYYESKIAVNDLLMVVKNNYFWLDETSKAGFIANGDTLRVNRIKRYHEIYGFHFAEITVELVDYIEQEAIDVYVLLDTLDLETPSLSFEQNKRLFEQVMLDYADLSSKRKQVEAVKKNPFFNALQIKYAYAVTCHKAQGGQWKQVFIDQGYITQEMINTEYYRWLYTALTRATEKVYLLNFNAQFFQ